MTEEVMIELEIGSMAAIVKSQDFGRSLATMCRQLCVIPGMKDGDPIEPQVLFDHNFALILAIGNSFVNAIQFTAASMGMEPGEIAEPAVGALVAMVEAMSTGMQPGVLNDNEGGLVQ